jgi:hypothetical protein
LQQAALKRKQIDQTDKPRQEDKKIKIKQAEAAILISPKIKQYLKLKPRLRSGNETTKATNQE